jgi:hypothetical protein
MPAVEGRFCRIMQRYRIRTIGVDPTDLLIRRARLLDPQGDDRIGCAEMMEIDEPADLVVSYLSLIDIADLDSAIAKMFGALRPSGTLLIANLTSFDTAGLPNGWLTSPGLTD